MFLVALVCPAETLKELLTRTGFPSATFTEKELSVDVDYANSENAQQIVIAYQVRKNGLLYHTLHMASYEKGKGVVHRGILQRGNDLNDFCSRALMDISFLHNYIVLEFHYNPSASCFVIVDKSFNIIRKINGIDWFEIAPNQLVVVENVIHFAPIHAERLRLLNLQHPGSEEIYPLKGDALRAHFIREHKKLMPLDKICSLHYDPCNPELFDEEAGNFASDGHGKIALLASLDASHATEKKKPPFTILSQSILYIYQQNKNGWLYCEQMVENSEAKILGKEMSGHFEFVANRCKPNLPVGPDMTTSGFSPFPQN
jgi:hypothetical protein